MHGERGEAYKKICMEWKEKNFIEPLVGRSEWGCQGFPVPKKSADFPWRGVVDLRGPNSQTRSCNYPLPKIEDILVKQGGNQMFSILDLKKAFHQQPLHPDSRHVTSTYTPFGVFQWKVNIMGLKNASQQFQQMIDDRLQGVKDVADPYVDDILIGTRVEPGENLMEAHERDIRRVLKVLEAEKLVAEASKSKFFVKSVEFCGHILENGTRRPAPGNLMVIEKWDVPRTVTELRAFLGFTNYYHTYIEGYADIVQGLQNKLKLPREEGKKGSKKRIEWNPEDQKAFDEIKKRLCSQLALQRVNPDKPFVLRVDASGYAVGASLEQLIDEDRKPTAQDVLEKKTVPVAFMSRKLAPGQRKWVPRELETYAIILALQKWETWIGMQPVTVLTDHKALEAWHREILDAPSGPVGRRLRWHQILSKFDLTVEYVSGKTNVVADALSRWAYPASQAMRDISKHGNDQDDEDMKRIIQEEREEEALCMQVQHQEKYPANSEKLLVAVTTRSGRETKNNEEEKMEKTSRLDPRDRVTIPMRGALPGPPTPESEGEEEPEEYSTHPPEEFVGEGSDSSDDDIVELTAGGEASQHEEGETWGATGGEELGQLDKPENLPSASPPPTSQRVRFQDELEGEGIATPTPRRWVKPKDWTGPIFRFKGTSLAEDSGLQDNQVKKGGKEHAPPFESSRAECMEGGDPAADTVLDGMDLGEIMEEPQGVYNQDDEKDKEQDLVLGEEGGGEHAPPLPRFTFITAKEVTRIKWDPFYAQCPRFGEIWVQIHQHRADWPKGYRIRSEKLFFHEKLCVPQALQNGWVREYHTKVGHVGSEKLWDFMQKHFEWGDSKHARDACFDVMQECRACQAC